MRDLRDGCFEDMRAVEAKATRADLETSFCKFCRNPECLHSQTSKDPFVKRVSTQLDRFFSTPQVKQSESSKWAKIPDFVPAENQSPLEIWTSKTEVKPEVKPELVKPILIPNAKNTSLPQGGLFIGEAPPPKVVGTPTDPWDSKPEKVVKSGARIKLDRGGNIIK